ncbi:MAG: LLM class F420-dependent oxidoreductase [Acidobacteria bacterium]|nr:LLM class F420-dependent oxidoreductase [Acidobacteriota bacterium]
MDYGLAFANTMTFASGEGAAMLGQAAEAAGFESVWTVEHVIYPEAYESKYPYDDSGKMMMATDTPLPDPLVWLTWLGAATEKIRLGTGILILPERNPVVLAKVLGTIDSFTGGRLELGIGVGWLEEEFDALGIRWEGRAARTDEYVEVMRALWSGDNINFSGEFMNFQNVSSNPKPAQGSVPIVVGGHSKAAARRAGRLGDGFFPAKGDLADLLTVMAESAQEHGRNVDDIVVSSGEATGIYGDDPVGGAEEARAKGIDRIIVPAFMFLENTEESLAEFGERVIAPTTNI